MCFPFFSAILCNLDIKRNSILHNKVINISTVSKKMPTENCFVVFKTVRKFEKENV